MKLRRTILLAAGALLAVRAAAEGTASDAQQPPPSSSRSQRWYQKDEQKARDLGQRGEAEMKKGATSAGNELNAGGQALNARVVGTKTVTGRIADASSDQVTVRKTDGTSTELRLSRSTKVTVDGKKAAAASLQQGDEIRASYAQSGGAATATKIDVTRAAGSQRGPAGRATSPGAGAPSR